MLIRERMFLLKNTLVSWDLGNVNILFFIFLYFLHLGPPNLENCEVLKLNEKWITVNCTMDERDEFEYL